MDDIPRNEKAYIRIRIIIAYCDDSELYSFLLHEGEYDSLVID